MATDLLNGILISESPSAPFNEWDILMYAGRADERYVVTNAVITQDIAAIDSFTFDIYPTNVHYDRFSADSAYRLWVQSGGFLGRVIGVRSGMDADGLIYKSVTCEGVEAILKDVSIDTQVFLEPGKVINPQDHGATGSPWTIELMADGSYKVKSRWYFHMIMDAYNDRVADDFKIRASLNYLMEGGSIFGTGVDSWYGDDGWWMYVTPTYGTVAYDLLTEFCENERLLVDPGFVQSTTITDPFEVVFDVHLTPAQVDRLEIEIILLRATAKTSHIDIELGKNMGSVSVEPDVTDIVTTVYPLGHEVVEQESYYIDGQEYLYDKPHRWTLNSYLEAIGPVGTNMITGHGFLYGSGNGGYITNQKLANKYGLISRPLVIEGCYSEMENQSTGQTDEIIDAAAGVKLLQKALNYLEQHAEPKKSISVTAYELSLLDYMYDDISIFGTAHLVNKFIGLDDYFYVVRKTINFDSPWESSVEFGTKARRLMESQEKELSRIKRSLPSSSDGRNDSSNSGVDNHAKVGETLTKAKASSGKSTPLLLPFNVPILEGLSGTMWTSAHNSYNLSNQFRINGHSMSQLEVKFCLQHILDKVCPGIIRMTPSQMVANGITKELVDEYAKYGLFEVRRYYDYARLGEAIVTQPSGSQLFCLTDITASCVRDSGREYIMNSKWEFETNDSGVTQKWKDAEIGSGTDANNNSYVDFGGLRMVKLTVDIGTRAYGDVGTNSYGKLGDLMEIRAHGYFINPPEVMQADSPYAAYVANYATARDSVTTGKFKFWRRNYVDDLMHNNGTYETYSTGVEFCGDLIFTG